MHLYCVQFRSCCPHSLPILVYSSSALPLVPIFASTSDGDYAITPWAPFDRGQFLLCGFATHFPSSVVLLPSATFWSSLLPFLPPTLYVVLIAPRAPFPLQCGIHCTKDVLLSALVLLSPSSLLVYVPVVLGLFSRPSPQIAFLSTMLAPSATTGSHRVSRHSGIS